MYYVGFSPFDGSPVMNEISSTSMEKSSSNHKNPPWRTTSNYLTHLFTYFPLSKWGISNKLRIHVFTKASTHYFGSSTGSPNDHVPRISIYTCYVNSGNLLVSEKSWYVYHSLSMKPSRLGVA